MNTRTIVILGVGIMLIAGVTGCGQNGSDGYTQDQINSIKNPPKTLTAAQLAAEAAWFKSHPMGGGANKDPAPTVNLKSPQ